MVAIMTTVATVVIASIDTRILAVGTFPLS
jgi:hypothetical protein